MPLSPQQQDEVHDDESLLRDARQRYFELVWWALQSGLSWMLLGFIRMGKGPETSGGEVSPGRSLSDRGTLRCRLSRALADGV